MGAKFRRPEEGEPGKPGTFFFSGCNQTGTRLPGGSASAASAGGSSALPAAGRSRIRSAQPRKRFLPSCPPPLRLAPLHSPSIQPEPPSLPPAAAQGNAAPAAPPPPARTPRSPAGSHAWAAAGWGRGIKPPAAGPAVLLTAMALPAPFSGMKPDGSALRCPHSTVPIALPRWQLPCAVLVALILMALPCPAPDVPVPDGTACSVLTNISDPNSTVLLCPPCHCPIVTHLFCPVPVEVMGDNTARPGQVDAVSAAAGALKQLKPFCLFSVSQNASLHPWCLRVKGTAKLCPSSSPQGQALWGS